MDRAGSSLAKDVELMAHVRSYTSVLQNFLMMWCLLYVQYHHFNTQQSYVLPTQCIYVLYVDLRTNSDYFPMQH